VTCILAAALVGSASGQTFTSLYSFGAVPGDGAAPVAGVIADPNGNLFGTAAVGGIQGSNGLVFELSPPTITGNPWTETILYRFRGTPDGKVPQSRLRMASKGVLVGNARFGGATNLSAAYSLTLGSQGRWKENLFYNYGSTRNDVVNPNNGFFQAAEGFYGADNGGANGLGAFYLLTPAGGGNWTQNILYSFQSNGDATFPSGDLVRDAAGNFYGAGVQGGANNLGAIYELSPPSSPGNPWTETVLFSFNGTDGTLPAGPLLLGPGGVLFGTTDGGGSHGAGTVFQLTPPTKVGDPWTHTILYNFTGGLDGTNPSSGVILDKKGRLFGAASNAVFMLTPQSDGTWQESVLHNFTGPDGFLANSPLTLFKGALYGTTGQGGQFGTGTVFQVTVP